MDQHQNHLRQLAERAGEIFDGRVLQQSGAICVREGASGREVLLITSRDTGRWVIPKGTIEKHEDSRQTAEREAMEEAGIVGKASKKPIGYYSYLKGKEGLACIVAVFVLEVSKAKTQFPEAKIRELAWVSPLEASRRVDEPELKGLFVKMAS